MSAPEPFATRLARAFSLRKNLRMLLVPAEGHLRPLDGLRALSILWVVVFHSGWYSGLHVPQSVYVSLLLSPWMLPVWRGDFGVDIFFVLSGFLIGGMLADERDRDGAIRFGLFYLRRLMRLWPALTVAVIADATLIGYHREMIWANWLYISNFIPISQAAMGWTWSLAIEEQFYLVCPLLVSALGSRKMGARLALIAGVALALAGVAAWVVVSGNFIAPDAEIVVNRDPLRWAVGYDHLYVKPWMRAGALLSGVAAAYVFRIPAAMDALARHLVTPVLGLVAALGVAAACTHWPLVLGAPREVEVAFLALYRTAFGISIAYILLLALSRHPVGQLLGRALSARVFYPFAQLAYAAYLFNPIVTVLVNQRLAPLAWQGVAPPMALFIPCDMVVTFLVAAGIHVFVERPFMNLRPRGT